MITHLKPNQVFVFGSNADGNHAGGAARIAYEKFGAVWGQGDGLQGQSYAIDTMSGWDALVTGVARFLVFARRNPHIEFLLTPIGTGIAGYRHERVAPLFANAPSNVVLPPEWVEGSAL